MTEVRTRLTAALNRLWNRQNRGMTDASDRQASVPLTVTRPTPPVQAVPTYAPSSNNPVPVSISNADITQTGPMIYFANDRHGHNDREYRFDFRKVNNGWRAYILRTPDFGNRNMGSAVIHRLQDSSGYYICWDRQVNTLKDMQIIARRWADSIQEYIATGRFG